MTYDRDPRDPVVVNDRGSGVAVALVALVVLVVIALVAVWAFTGGNLFGPAAPPDEDGDVLPQPTSLPLPTDLPLPTLPAPASQHSPPVWYGAS